MRFGMVVVVWVAALGCGKGSDSSSAPGSAAAPHGSASGSVASESAASGSSGSGSGSGSAVPVAALSPKIEAAKCGEPCLFLLDTPIATLTDSYKSKCGGMETKNLGFDDCKQLDYARNCIYAAHGLVYKKASWKKKFEAKPWYEPRADVDAKKIAMSEVEHANVHELYERGKACKKNLKISGADYDRLKAWFSALPKPAMPKQAFTSDSNGQVDNIEITAVDGKAFLAWLAQEAPGAKAKVAGGKDVYASYEDPAVFAKQTQLVAALKPSDPSKLRSIVIDVEGSHGTEEEPYSEGVNLRFVYDDKDQLVAITGDHYSFD